MSSISHVFDILKKQGFGSLYRRLRYKLASPNYAHWRSPVEEEDIDVKLLYNPVVSIVLPVFNNCNDSWLIQAVESVVFQCYSRWQLCIVAASKYDHVRSVLPRFVETDERIEIIAITENSGISDALNNALEIAKGEFFALLEPDARLARNALYEVVKYVNIYPDADFIYTDEDCITSRGKRKNPFFKPDWSPDYFQAYMYTGHLGIYRVSLTRKVGKFRSEYDGAQDWDLALRLTEKTNRIHHIPQVLYHRRLLSTAAFVAACNESWTCKVAQKALQNAVDRSSYPGRVEAYSNQTALFRVRRYIQGKPLVSIIIPSAGTCLTIKGQQTCLLEQCVNSIRQRSTYENIEIILVDGYDIPERYLRAVQGPALKLVRCDDPFNFSQRMNYGVRESRGDVLLLLNDDTEIITSDWIESMLELAQQKEIAAVGAKLLYPNGRLQHAGMVLLAGNPSHAFHNGSGKSEGYYYSNIVNRNYLGVTAACLMMRRNVFEELNGFDEKFPLSYNDVDLCLRAHQAGYRNVFTPHAELLHYESVSRVSKLKPGELERLHGRFLNTSYMVDDPYYNPNLSIYRPFFQLAWPDEPKRQRRK